MRRFLFVTLFAAFACTQNVPVDWEASEFAFAAVGEDPGDFFGWSVAGVGDVNGDTFGDVVVGAPQHDRSPSAVDSGAAYLFLGGPGGPSPTPAWEFKAIQAGASFGHAVAAAGDVNNDGLADVIIGAPRWDDGEVDEGRVFLFLGSATTGLGANPSWTRDSGQVGAQLGFAVAGAGDTDNDGLDDIIAGAPRYDNSFADEGGAFLFRGTVSGDLGVSPTWTAFGGEDAAAFGTSVSGAGDVDNDGLHDIIVGAPRAGPLDSEGRAYLYRGAAGGPNTTPVWSPNGDQAGAQFGQSVSAAGDVNGDGFDDVVVGAFSFDNGETDEGVTFVYHGLSAGAGSISALPAWNQDGNQVGAFFGVSVAAGGFVDGDGHSDIIVGGHGFERGQDNEGAAMLFFGAPQQALDVGPNFESNQKNSVFGASVSGRSDVDGDGQDEIIVGAYAYDTADAEDVGRVFVYPVD